MTAVDDLFTDGVKMLHGEAVELTLASLRAYWPRHQHVAVVEQAGVEGHRLLGRVPEREVGIEQHGHGRAFRVDRSMLPS